MHLRWQVLEQKGEVFVNRFGIDYVVVVQNEDEMIWESGDFVEQGGQDRLRMAVAEAIGGQLTRPLRSSAQLSAMPPRGKSENAWGRYPLRPVTARRPVARNRRPIR